MYQANIGQFLLSKGNIAVSIKLRGESDWDVKQTWYLLAAGIFKVLCRQRQHAGDCCQQACSCCRPA
eukprot:1146438-Pelagomonas_calceolata.AAC.3